MCESLIVNRLRDCVSHVLSDAGMYGLDVSSRALFDLDAGKGPLPQE